MRALITGARMFFAVDQIRKLGDAGHEVFAADTFRAAPGRHSRDVTHRRLVPPPASEPLAFVAAVAELVHDESIDLVLPQFEEVFYLARHRNVLEGLTECFFGEFDVMARLHDKASFCAFMDELGLPIRNCARHDLKELAATVFPPKIHRHSEVHVARNHNQPLVRERTLVVAKPQQ